MAIENITDHKFIDFMGVFENLTKSFIGDPRAFEGPCPRLKNILDPSLIRVSLMKPRQEYLDVEFFYRVYTNLTKWKFPIWSP